MTTDVGDDGCCTSVLTSTLDEADAADLAAAFAALADPTRRAILRLVHDREVAAGEIASHFPSMSRPAVSQHLRVLAEADLVEGVRRLAMALADCLDLVA